ncbi:MAG: hypothetical protein ACYC6J_08675 [Coriobacteriia bacterium]
MPEKLLACVNRKAIERATDDDVVTLDCKVSLTRAQWRRIGRRMAIRAIADKIGMQKMSESDLIVLQVMQQNVEGKR